MTTKLSDTAPLTLSEARGPELLVPMRLRMPGHLTRRFHRVHVAMMSEALAALDLSAASYGALVSIDRTPGITQRTLANERGLDAVTAGQTVDELERQGLVRRRADPDDRRAWRLELTAKGMRIRDRAAPAALAAQARMLSVLSNDEVTKLRELLARVIEANADYDRPGAGRRRPSTNRKSKRGGGNA
jgi:DNA-binding MarR family transcriptional regulator